MLLRSFIEFPEFQAALVHLNFVGVQHDVEVLFDRYDTDGSGMVSYTEFCGAVFKLVPSVANDPKSRSAVERVRAKIASRGGMNGIRTLGRILRTMDDNGNGQLDRYELEWGLRDYGLEMSEGVRCWHGCVCVCVCVCVSWCRLDLTVAVWTTGLGRLDEGFRSRW